MGGMRTKNKVQGLTTTTDKGKNFHNSAATGETDLKPHCL